jgi:protein-S-isoprenylcysteine O-methyltransferase Ste14
MTIYQQIVAACWAVLLVVWFVLALALGPPSGHHSRHRWLLRLGGVAVLVLAVFLITRGRRPPVLFEPTRPVAIVGVALCIVGLAFALWARVTMGRHWAVPIAEREESDVVSTGPFAYVRHPIYAGVIAMMIGSALNVPGAYAEVLTAIVSLLVLARKEEREMARLLPHVYPPYMERTKRFVPFVF